MKIHYGIFFTLALVGSIVSDSMQLRSLRGDVEPASQVPLQAQGTSIFSAVRQGNIGDVKRLVCQDGSCACLCDKHGWTPLFHAVDAGNYDMVVYLIEVAGANPAACDHAQQTPLHCAALHGYGHIVQYLITKSPELLKATDGDGWTPLHAAAKGSQLAAEGLLPASSCEDNDHCFVINVLLEGGADATLKDSNSKTAYDLASEACKSTFSDFYKKSHQASEDDKVPGGEAS